MSNSMLELDPETVNPRQGKLILIAALIFLVVGSVGVFIANRPNHSDWLDDFGLIEVFWGLVAGGLFGLVAGAAIIAFCATDLNSWSRRKFDDDEDLRNKTG
jgi:hypothetical protein